MNEHLRDRIIRKLESLTDERGYQVLDFVEFLESKFADRQNPQGNAFTRFTEAVEDKLRAGRVSASAIAETMGLLNKAANVLNGAVAAGKSVASDIVTVAQSATVRSAGGTAPASTPTPGTTPSTTATPHTGATASRTEPKPGGEPI